MSALLITLFSCCCCCCCFWVVLVAVRRARVPDVRRQRRRYHRFSGVSLRPVGDIARQTGTEAQMGLLHVRPGRQRIHFATGNAGNRYGNSRRRAAAIATGGSLTSSVSILNKILILGQGGGAAGERSARSRGQRQTDRQTELDIDRVLKRN